MKKYWIGVLLLTSMPAWAISPWGATPAEVAMCEARGMPGGQGRWQGHYCDGLRFTDRAYSAIGNKQDIKYYLEAAIDNFNYVLGHTKEDDVMRGEVHVGKARALKLQGKKGEAAGEYIKALRYTPNSSAIYLALADFYQEMGDKPKALEMVTEGLMRSPDSKGLKLRYTELGGKLPYPESLVKKPEPSSAVDATDTAKAPSTAPQAAAAPGTETDSTPPAPTPPTAATEKPADAPAPPKIGSPTNPWCRFCTDSEQP